MFLLRRRQSEDLSCIARARAVGLLLQSEEARLILETDLFGRYYARPAFLFSELSMLVLLRAECDSQGNNSYLETRRSIGLARSSVLHFPFTHTKHHPS